MNELKSLVLEAMDDWKNNELRGKAATALKEAGDEGIKLMMEDVLVNVQIDTHEYVCAKEIFKAGCTAASVPKLEEYFNEADPESYLQHTLLDTLAKIGTDEAMDIIASSIVLKSEWRGRRAIEILGESGNPRFVPLLVEKMHNGHPFEVDAAKALDKIGRIHLKGRDGIVCHLLICNIIQKEHYPKKAIPHLLKEMVNPSALVRQRAAQALGQFEEAEKDLLVLLKHEIHHVRCAAAIGLKVLGKKTSLEPLVTALRKEEGASAKRMMVEALGKFPHNDAIIALHRVLTDEEAPPTLKEKAVASLGEIRVPNAARVLIYELPKGNVHPMEVARALRRTYPSDRRFLKMLVRSVREMKEKNPQNIGRYRLHQVAMWVAEIHDSWGQWLSERAKEVTHPSKIPMALRNPKPIKPEEISRIKRINRAKRAI